MPIVLTALLILMGLAVLYLSVAATVCVALDPSLSSGIKWLRILIAWLIPILGAIVTIWVALDSSKADLRRRWWLWPLRPLLDAEPETGFQEVVDMRADAERSLPGQTLTPP